MRLASLIRNPRVSLEEIGALLDRLLPSARLDAAMTLGPRDQAILFERAGQAPAITLDHFVPSDVPDLREVIHEGRNSLPLFRRFQKRFCRPRGETARLFGYNEGQTRALLGPGYFVVVPTSSRPDWASRGALVVDYFQVPDGLAAPGWPAVVENSRGLQRLVYFQTRDFMRRVSAHISIGRAWKNESRLPATFVLCRQDRR